MIGKITMGKSFQGCLNYCLENKPEQIAKSMEQRAEILDYNYCFGDKKELIQQFNDIRNLNPNLLKPVMHITLSFAPGEKIPEPKLYDMIYECAEQMGFKENLYVAIAHKDTVHQHIHIVVNRVGLDGKTLSDSHNYRKISEYCRRMEKKHSLERVLSPVKFLPKEQREVPRISLRKEDLRAKISACLLKAKNFGEFEKLIKQDYDVIKARGIAFVDKEKVKIKGSEVGYSLKRIEQLFSFSPSQKNDTIQSMERGFMQRQDEYLDSLPSSSRIKKEIILRKAEAEKQKKQNLGEPLPQEVQLQSHSDALEVLLKPEKETENIDSNFLQKKKQKRSHHL